MHQARPELRCDVLPSTRLGQGDQPLAVLARLGSIGPGAGIEKRQPRDPSGGLTHDLESDVSTHGQSGEREQLRSLAQEPCGHIRDRIVARMIRYQDRALLRQGCDLRLKKT
jgi:hypothetical protein